MVQVVQGPIHCTCSKQMMIEEKKRRDIGCNGVVLGPPGPRPRSRPSWLDSWMDGLRDVTPSAASSDIVPNADVHRAEPARVTPISPRWPAWDERGAKPCKRCGYPIIFGRIESDEWGEATTLRSPDRRPQRWMILDPDLMPHQCDKVNTART